MVIGFSQSFRFTVLLRRSGVLRCVVTALWLLGWALSAEGVGPVVGGWLAGLDGVHQRHLTVDSAGKVQLVLSHSRDVTGHEDGDVSWDAVVDGGGVGEDHFILLDGADSTNRRRGRLWLEAGGPVAMYVPVEGAACGLAESEYEPARCHVSVVDHAALLVKRSRKVMRC